MRPHSAQRPAHPAPIGIWLSQRDASDVNVWAAKSVVPVVVARLGLHTVLVPRGLSAVGAPYDDAAMMCAARPVPLRVAPALGFWVIDDRAVLTVYGTDWRRTIRWVIWDPELGMLRPPGVQIATPDQVVRAAGGGVTSELIEILAERHHPPQRLLSAVVSLLGLPGADVLLTPEVVQGWSKATRHEPEARQVDIFEDAVKDAVALRRELGISQ